MSNRHLINRKARAGNCQHCGDVTLTGISWGMSYTVDLNAINHAGEIDAVLDGLHTYWTVGPGELEPRMVTDIARRSADTHTVLVAHRCGRHITPDRRSDIPPHHMQAAIALVRAELGGTVLIPPF